MLMTLHVSMRLSSKYSRIFEFRLLFTPLRVRNEYEKTKVMPLQAEAWAQHDGDHIYMEGEQIEYAYHL